MLQFIKKPITGTTAEQLDFPDVDGDDVSEIPAHLVPTEQMTQEFITNCKEMGVWE